jgi:hypothetical protein
VEFFLTKRTTEIVCLKKYGWKSHKTIYITHMYIGIYVHGGCPEAFEKVQLIVSWVLDIAVEYPDD